MARFRFPLFSRILLWFFLNLIAIAAIVAALIYFRTDNRSSLLSGLAGQIEGVVRRVETDTGTVERSQRDAALQAYSEQYASKFYLFDFNGRQLGGEPVTLPASVSEEITRSEGLVALRNDPPSRDPTGGIGPPIGMGGPPPSVYFTTDNPRTYWFVGRIMTLDLETGNAIRSRVVVASDSITGHGLFLDLRPIAVVLITILGFSIVFWFPFVRRITTALSQMKKATKDIAEEQFDVRVASNRSDEIGELGEGIDQMAERLSGFIRGKKRFLGEISHELNSPLARMQFALSILEHRVSPDDVAYVEDVKEEVATMTKLVDELLTYSKSGLKGRVVEMETVDLEPLISSVIERENAIEKRHIDLLIDAGLIVSGRRELISRALSNIVRNALKHSPENSPITLNAYKNGNGIVLSVADTGPGVPDEMLDRIFDPLFRVQTDRSRQTGGTGLGLAIVKTCVEACGGKVQARNVDPQGLAIEVTLATA